MAGLTGLNISLFFTDRREAIGRLTRGRAYRTKHFTILLAGPMAGSQDQTFHYSFGLPLGGLTGLTFHYSSRIGGRL
jgi:hypothetical protein